MDADNVMRLVRLGEGETVEFKSDGQGVAETTCAMANTEGGTILVGINDDGSVKGVSKKDDERVSSALKGLSPPPRMSIEKVQLNGKAVLIVKVEPMRVLVSIGPIAYIRVGRGNRPLSITELIQRSIQLGQIQFDLHPSQAPPDTLDRSALKRYLEERERNRGVKRKGSLDDNARRLKVIVKGGDGPMMSYAGLLCFSKKPQDYLASAVVRAIELDGKGETVSTKEFDGPVCQMAGDVLRHLTKGFRSLEIRVGAARRHILEYPEWAVREAIVNAVAHRNYSLDADIRIFTHPDRLVIRSPGGFPQGVTPEHPEHRPVNPLLCQYLYDLGMIERYGYGITNMFAEAKRHPFCELSYDVTPTRVDVIFSRSVKKGLDDTDQRIMALLGDGAMSSTEIAGDIGISRAWAVSRLKKLEAIGLVKKEGKGPATVYRIRER
jgi:ATP-dependent DNA helicase RecG